MLDVGRICMKIAGRDAGKTCVVVDNLEKGYVLVDGETRRRKVNPEHLEATPKVIELNKGANHEEVKTAFKTQLRIELTDKKPKEAKKEQTGKTEQPNAKVEKKSKK